MWCLQADAFPASTPLHLHWQYRKQNLLRELLAYKADVLCLQEVQSNHIHDFLAPELDKVPSTLDALTPVMEVLPSAITGRPTAILWTPCCMSCLCGQRGKAARMRSL